MRGGVQGVQLAPAGLIGDCLANTGVSRDTVRRAMALLRDEGVVFTVPRRGTYVGPQPT